MKHSRENQQQNRWRIRSIVGRDGRLRHVRMLHKPTTTCHEFCTPGNESHPESLYSLMRAVSVQLQPLPLLTLESVRNVLWLPFAASV